MTKIKTGWNRPITFSTNTKYSSTKKQEFIITDDESLKQTQDYKNVNEVISRLVSTGLARMGEGYCISVSDILYNILSQSKIKCHLVEVQLSIVNQITEETYMIGYETTYQQNTHKKVSTHVVVVTDTEIPMLIDMSIAHRLPGEYQVVIAKAGNIGNKVLTTFEYENTGFIYQEKKDGVGIPAMHQTSILDRIATDQKIFDSIKQLKYLNYIGITLGTFAVINVLLKLLNIF